MKNTVISYDHVIATMNYLVKTGVKPCWYCYEQQTLSDWRGVSESRELPIMDARGRETDFSLDRHGFCFVRQPSNVHDFFSDSSICRYYEQCTWLVKQMTGASWAMAFDHTIRGADLSNIPVMRVHNDYTAKSASIRIREFFSHTSEHKSDTRFAFVNVWRPIGNQAVNTPLALCDGTTFEESDVICSDIVYKGRVLEIGYANYNPGHRWYHLSGMSKDEVVLFKGFDSVDYGQARICPHSAFVHPGMPQKLQGKRSIEVRTVVMFK